MSIQDFLSELCYWYPLQARRIEALDVVPEPWIINYDHPTYIVETIEKLGPCQNRKIAGWTGRNFWIWVKDLYLNALPNVRITIAPAYGRGTISERPLIWGLTKNNGWAEYVHPQVVTYYTIGVDDIWLIDHLWTNSRPTYCNPAPWPPGPGEPYGWRPAEMPGDGSYHIRLRRRW